MWKLIPIFVVEKEYNEYNKNEYKKIWFLNLFFLSLLLQTS